MVYCYQRKGKALKKGVINMKNTNNTKVQFNKATQFSLIIGGFIAMMIILNIITGLAFHDDILSEFTVKDLILDHIAAVITASLVVFKPWRLFKSHKAV